MPTPAIAALVPLPSVVEPSADPAFVLTADVTIAVASADERVRRIAHQLAAFIGTSAAADPPAVVDGASADAPGTIALAIDPAAADMGDEGYELVVSRDRVRIRARQPAGLFYGVQTFRQLLPAFVEYEAARPSKTRPVTAAAGRIADAPRFSWRGAMLDVSRHFFPVADVKRFIDLMALYKLNRLHLHLSDDQGWRIDILSWPNLAARGGATEVGGGPGGFYTQAQYAELVAYAADRFITIVPEIDVPGHTNAALASYPQLNCDGVARPLYTGVEVGFSALCVDSEVTYAFVDDVVRELAALTPGPWIHMGGDEVKTLTPAQYASFIERVQAIVRSHGKQMIGWDEISSASLDPSTVVQHWRPKASMAAAVARGARVILSVANRAYLDMKYDPSTPIGLAWAGHIDVRTAYDWDPSSAVEGVPESSLLGIEAPLWTETVATMDDAEYLLFPRLAALAEVAWTAAAARDWDTFRWRLGAQGPRLTALGVNFYRAPEIRWEP